MSLHYVINYPEKHFNVLYAAVLGLKTTKTSVMEIQLTHNYLLPVLKFFLFLQYILQSSSLAYSDQIKHYMIKLDY